MKLSGVLDSQDYKPKMNVNAYMYAYTYTHACILIYNRNKDVCIDTYISIKIHAYVIYILKCHLHENVYKMSL